MGKSREHLDEVGESYFEHMGQASRFGTRMIVTGFACLVHGLIPSMFIKTGSQTINELNDRMVRNRVKTKSDAVIENPVT